LSVLNRKKKSWEGENPQTTRDVSTNYDEKELKNRRTSGKGKGAGNDFLAEQKGLHRHNEGCGGKSEKEGANGGSEQT